MTERHGHLPRIALAAADLGAALSASLAAYALRFGTVIADWVPITGRTDVLPARYAEALPVALAAMVGGAALAGAHGRDRLGRPASVGEALRAGLVSGAVLAALVLVYRERFQYSRLTIALAAALFAPAFLACRALAARLLASLRRNGRFRTPAAVVGGGAPAAALAQGLASNPWMGIDVLAVHAVGETPIAWRDAERLDDVTALVACVRHARVAEVFVALPAGESSRIPSLLEALSDVRADVHVVPDLGGAVLLNPGAAILSGVPIVSARSSPLYGVRAAAKRALDFTGALVLLVALSPLLALLALAVRVTSKGPVLYRQERMGLDGTPFRMLKLRTMRVDAEEATGPVFARPGDPRVTPLGRVLRRLSLDELPQLWNVLRGEMSLVGPRPERGPFIAEFRQRMPGYMLRHSVKAGMTGWAQVHGLRGGSSLEQRLRYDLEYIDRWSLLLDLEILGRTALQVLVGRNAC